MRRYLAILLCAVLLNLSFCAHAATIGGKILGPDNKPVAGAKVMIVSYSRFNSETFDKSFPIVTSDAEGVWSATVDLSATADKTGGGVNGLVIVHAPGLAITHAVWDGNPLTMRLKKGARATGLVVDGAGNPVAGALLKLRGVRLEGKGDFRL